MTLTLLEKEKKTRRRLNNYINQAQYPVIKELAEQVEKKTGLIIIEK